MAVTVAPEPGAIVVYHGSVVEYHGLCRMSQICGYCSRCWGHDQRVHLTHIITSDPLRCVNLTSISAVDFEEVGRAAYLDGEESFDEPTKNGTVWEALSDTPVDDPLTAEVYRAFRAGWPAARLTRGLRLP